MIWRAPARCAPWMAEMPTPPQYRFFEGPAQAESIADVPWWEIAEDAQLQALIREAIASNLDLRVAPTCHNYEVLVSVAEHTDMLVIGPLSVLHGYERKAQHVHVADPLPVNPLGNTHQYAVEMDRLISAIHLGVLTYDANLLILVPH